MEIYRPTGGFRTPVLAGGVATTATLLFYSVVVAATTPNFAPLTAVGIAFNMNGPIMLGISIGMGIQTFLVMYSRRLPCPIGKKRAALSTAGSGSALSAFFSFFALTQVGCCGLWLFYLSLLPGILGVGASGFLIQHSGLLSSVGLVAIALSILLMLRSIRRSLRELTPRSESGGDKSSAR